MPRGRKPNTLSSLERRLHALDVERALIVENIKAVVAGLTAGASHFIEAEKKDLAPIVRRIKRRFSPAARLKLRAAAKKRWAEAKKAGRTRLG